MWNKTNSESKSEHLPIEILQEIFVHMREQHGVKATVPLLTVSRYWNEAFTPLLYGHVVLDNRALPLFSKSDLKPLPILTRLTKWLCLFLSEDVDCFPISSTPSSCPVFNSGSLQQRDEARTWQQVKSLALRVVPKGEYPRRHEQTRRDLLGTLTMVDSDIERLSIVLRRLRSLESFSFFSEDSGVCSGWHHPWALQKLIMEIPVSCTNLQIDTNGRDCSIRAETSPRLCLVIHEMMPRLRHLKLRVGSICSAMVMLSSGDRYGEEPTFVLAAHMETLSVSYVPREFEKRPYSYEPCIQVCSEPHVYSLSVAEEPADEHYFAGINKRDLDVALKKAREKGCFPNIKVLEVEY